ncbi:MAG: polyprenyl synthetase family protein [Acutalibacteraceae bacterium]
MNKSSRLDEYISVINRELSSCLPECFYGEPIVTEAMQYSLMNGGKRIRPVLTLEFCRMCGGDINDALPFACAVEMIHTYSLIHDDLPCMDNDAMRRGKPSCHIQYGESYALLAGDALLTYAFEYALKSELMRKDPACGAEALRTLSACSGISGMVGGQVIDLKSEDKNVSIDTLRMMDSLKTGALIKAAAYMGTVIGKGSDEQKSAAVQYAESLGQAFQIVDDILDVTADEATLGKPVGSDKESGKSTYVALLGLDQSQKIADELTEKAIQSLDAFPDNGFLIELTRSLASRKN